LFEQFLRKVNELGHSGTWRRRHRRVSKVVRAIPQEGERAGGTAALGGAGTDRSTWPSNCSPLKQRIVSLARMIRSIL
jgi:hypothetical protein